MRLSLVLLLCAACSGRIESTNDPVAAPREQPVVLSLSKIPVGVWALQTQWGPADSEVRPGGVFQIEIQSDGSAYRWTCDGESEDAAPLTAPCERSARIECLRTHVEREGDAFRIVITDPPVYADQGLLKAEGANLRIPYVNPPYQAASFARVGEATDGVAGCWRY